MGWKNLHQKLHQKAKFLGNSTICLELFQVLTITLLSLLLPLSFLLLSRLSWAQYLSKDNSYYSSFSSKPYSYLFSIFLYTNPTLIHVLVSILSVATLTHCLTGKITIFSESIGATTYQPRLYVAWIFLCTLQVCVGLGIEGSIAAGIDGSNFGGSNEKGFLSRVIFFLGLHETMMYWFRIVVKPVVDDTVFGGSRPEKWVEKVALALSCGGLWWWRLRDEVELLVLVAELKKEMLFSVGLIDFVGWWLYYLTVTIGMVRIVKGLMWVGIILLCKIENREDSRANEEKV